MVGCLVIHLYLGVTRTKIKYLHSVYVSLKFFTSHARITLHTGIWRTLYLVFICLIIHNITLYLVSALCMGICSVVILHANTISCVRLCDYYIQDTRYGDKGIMNIKYSITTGNTPKSYFRNRLYITPLI